MLKTILITGASSGIGKELAKFFLNKDYQLILSDKDKEGFREFPNNNKVNMIIGDITKDDTLKQLKVAIEKVGRLDILINNAGITYIQPFEKNTDEQLDQIIEINLKSHIRITRMIYPFMVKQQKGTIVFINSSAGKEGKLHHTMYCATKFGLKGFADSLRLEAKKNNIRVISIHPGGFKSNLYRNQPEVDQSAFMDPAQVAKVIFFLSETEGLSPDEIVINRMKK